ncbi:MAG: hypothetical protein IJ111_02315, partial [Eggerthellaceae bacterium]|nr:hypothetical protein [Eggerthellaceae bacterium]
RSRIARLDLTFALIGRAKARASKAKGLAPLLPARLNATVFDLQIQLSRRSLSRATIRTWSE